MAKDPNAPKRKNRKGAGRPPYVPDERTRGKVETLAAMGLPQTNIARKLGIDPKTLREHFREELDMGKAEANFAVVQTLYKFAVGDPGHPGDPERGIPPKDPVKPQLRATIFWAKTQCGFSTTSKVEHTGADGKPIQVETNNFDVDKIAKLPKAERKNFLETLRGALKEDGA